MKIWCGIDNGSSGSLGIIRENGTAVFGAVPHKSEQSYTKKEQNVTRIDFKKLSDLLREEISYGSQGNRIIVLIERPFVSPKGFKATMSAMRALEAVLIAVEENGLPYQYIDSKEWQKSLLPQGTVGTADLKLASLQ